MTRGIRLRLPTAAAALTLVACLTSPGPARATAHSQATANPLKPPSSCKQVEHPSSTYFLNSNGARGTHATATTTTVTIFHLQGMTVPVYATPRSFDPATATPGLLKQIGIAPRPHGGPSLRTWLRRYEKRKGLRSITPPWLCVTSLWSAGEDSPSLNWSGIETFMSQPVGQGSYGYTSSQGASSSLPALESGTCPQPVGLAMWSGLGGNAKNPLMQAGVAANSDGTFSLWYEIVADPSLGLPTFPEIDTGVLASEGDDVEYDTQYWPAIDADTPAQVQFDFNNYTTNTSLTVGPIYQTQATNGTVYPISDYFTGTSAEVITEAPATLNGQIESLEEPVSGQESFNADWEMILNDDWSYSLEPMSEDPNLNYLYIQGFKTGNTISAIDDFTASSDGDSWNTVWLGCN